jgi:hypothetical protein
MPMEGQRTRSSRWSHDHPGSPGEPVTGQRGLEIPGILNPRGTAIGCRNQRGRRCENTQVAGVGAPDVVKDTCPVRGALGGIPLLRGSMDAVLRLHQVSGAGESHAQEANVAEVSYGEAVNGKAENPEIIKPPGGSRERIGVTPSNAPRKRNRKVAIHPCPSPPMHAGREQRRGGTVGHVWSSRGAQQGVARCPHAGPWP